MKRGKDNDKVMGAMFPRLNVNDREKGGPKAPPRNKMALYEQFTIPSQRYNTPQGSTTIRAPSTSTLEGTSHEQNTYFPHYQPQSTSPYDEAQIIRPEENRKVSSLDEDDFMVPIFSQPGTQSCIEKPKNSIHEESQSHSPIVLENPTAPPGINLNRDPISKERRYTCNILVREKVDDIVWKKDNCTHSGYHKVEKNGVSLLKDHEDDSLELEEYQSLENESIDKGGASMVDTITSLDISPDDVVRIIGPKHFWKARTAIATQQRVFAVQIFELHRLIKVQKLIAKSPELLLGSAFVGKSSLKGSTMKKYSSLNHKSSTLKDISSHKGTGKVVEGTAENAVTKSPPISLQPPPPYRSSSVNPLPVNIDPNTNSCSFPQPSPHQWLVPVMSPSEGLVYKLHPGGIMPPSYGHYQGMHFGGQGYFPPYGMPMPMPMPMPIPMPMPMPFPMPMESPSMSGSTVEQLNSFSGQNPYGKTMNFNVMHHQGSMNMPEHPPKEREVQGCSESSPPSQKTQETCEEVLPPVEKSTRVIRVVPHKPGCTRESAARIFQSIQEERRQFE